LVKLSEYADLNCVAVLHFSQKIEERQEFRPVEKEFKIKSE